MQIDITQVAIALIGLLATIITAYAVPAIKDWRVRSMVKGLVFAAESIFAGNGQGRDKYQWVEEQLADKGVKLSGDALQAAIQAAVTQLWAELGQ